MPARVFKVDNRLAKVVRLPGGRSIAEALAAAEKRIEAIREDCIASIGPQAAALQRFAEAGRGGDEGALAGLYTAANEVFSIAGAFGLSALGEAAYSLCDIVDRFKETGQISWAAVDVHIDGIRLLAQGDEAAAKTIIQGLRQVRARFVE